MTKAFTGMRDIAPFAAVAVMALVLLPVSYASGADIKIAGPKRDEAKRLFTEPTPPRLAAPGELIVKLRDNAVITGDHLTAADANTSWTEASGGDRIYRGDTGGLPEADGGPRAEERTGALIQYFSSYSDSVEYVQRNWILTAATEPNDPGYRLQWDYFTNGVGSGKSPGGINLPGAWSHADGEVPIIVAVIDTGLVLDHPDLNTPAILPGYDFISDAAISGKSPGRHADPTDAGDGFGLNECPGRMPQPSSWHGSHVSGTVGAVASNNRKGIAGVDWGVKILPIRVLGKCGGKTSDINDGIRWAAGLPVPGVPDNPNKAQIINMSLGGNVPCSESPATQKAIDDVVSVGVTVIVAAGNDHTDTANTTPGGCKHVISVSASGFDGKLVERYSNYGKNVAIMAPGGDLNSHLNGGPYSDGILSIVKDGFNLYNGTSMAAPHVAGVAALLLAKHPTLKPERVLEILQKNALPRTCPKGDGLCGTGLLNADMPELMAPLADDMLAATH